MKVLICGDIVGRSGREVVKNELPKLVRDSKIDFVIVNGENAANGFGITPKICEELYSCGVDVITTGNHIWDQKEIIEHIETDKRLIRPCNYPRNSPGNGYGVFKVKDGNEIIIINLMCRLFMDPLDNPFESINEILDILIQKYDNPVFLIDIHGESTSEKMALAHFLDGRVTGIFGTHTHVPTSDLQILEKGSFYQTDLGMCGDYNSVIGMKKEPSINRFTKKHIKSRLETANGEGTLCGTVININDNNRVNDFNQIIIGGTLQKK